MKGLPDNDITVVNEQQAVESNNSNNTSKTPAELEVLAEAKERRAKEQAYRDRDKKLEELKNQRRLTAIENGTFKPNKKEKSIKEQNKEKDEGSKVGIIGKVYNGPGGRYMTQRQYLGSFVNRSILKTLNAGFGTKDNFNNNLSAENTSRVIAKDGETKEVIEDFSGWSGFLNLLWLAGTPNKESSLFMKMYIWGQYLNPANYLLFCSLLIDEFIQDAALIGGKEDEKPGLIRMTLHGIFGLGSSLQRFVITSACKPLVYARKNPKVFTAVFLAAAAALNTVVYAFQSQENLDHETLYDMYKNMAADIFDNIIMPMIGGIHMSVQDREQTIAALTGFLVNYSAVIIASMGSQMGRKGAALLRGIQLVHHSDETRFVDGLQSGYTCMTNAWSHVKTCVLPEKAALTEAEMLAQLDALETGIVPMQQLPPAAGNNSNNNNNINNDDIQVVVEDLNINNTHSGKEVSMDNKYKCNII